MTITNRLNLPQALVDAVSTRAPSGAYSGSMMTKTPRQVWLARRHYSEMSEDVADRIWSLFGTAVHAIIEASAGTKSLAEEYLRVTLPNGETVSGVPDLYEDGKISDWKTVSVWSVAFYDDQKRMEYEAQLNTYAYLYRAYGFPVRELEIVWIMRDWQANKARYNADYPDCQVRRLSIRLWGADEMEAYLIERTGLFGGYANTPDDELPECSAADRWAKAGTWAVMKKGRKAALRVLSTEEEAAQWMEANGGDEVVHRPGEQWTRCEYCAGRPWCNQWRAGNDG
jgi:hypothetical protein